MVFAGTRPAGEVSVVFSGAADLAIETASLFVDSFLVVAMVWSHYWTRSGSEAGYPREVPMVSDDQR